MQTALYLIPVTLEEAPLSDVIPMHTVELLKTIKHYIVESRRSAVRFLVKADTKIDIDSLTFFELNEHTDLSSIEDFLAPLAQGNPIGVLSEAGCPAVADPGSAIVALAHRRKFKVVPLAGPSSIIMSLMASGFNGQNFAFNGYLPPKPVERAGALRTLEQKAIRNGQTQIFIETPYRNSKMLETILQTCKPETQLCIAAGLTGKDELIRTKSIAEWKKLPPQEREIGKIPAVFLLFR